MEDFLKIKAYTQEKSKSNAFEFEFGPNNSLRRILLHDTALCQLGLSSETALFNNFYKSNADSEIASKLELRRELDQIQPLIRDLNKCCAEIYKQIGILREDSNFNFRTSIEDYYLGYSQLESIITGLVILKEMKFVFVANKSTFL